MDVSFLTNDVLDEIEASGRPITRKDEILLLDNRSFHSQHWPSKASFPDARVVVLRLGDKNEVYYNFNSVRFPKVEYVYCYCHPCDSDVPSRFGKATWHVDDRYRFNRYFGMWHDGSPCTVRRVVLDDTQIIVPNIHHYQHEEREEERRSHRRCAKIRDELIMVVAHQAD